MTSPLRGRSTTASLVYNGSRPQTPLSAVSLAIASPTAVTGYAGHACTDFQKGGHQRNRRFCATPQRRCHRGVLYGTSGTAGGGRRGGKAGCPAERDRRRLAAQSNEKDRSRLGSRRDPG